MNINTRVFTSHPSVIIKSNQFFETHNHLGGPSRPASLLLLQLLYSISSITISIIMIIIATVKSMVMSMSMEIDTKPVPGM